MIRRPGKLAEAIASKAFATQKLQQAWAVHMQAFGPILAPAFADCCTAKVHLINILNKISRRDTVGAKETLETLERSCGFESAAEMALKHFLLGLCGEVSGDQDEMAKGYLRAEKYGHRFYLPYLKLGKMFLQSGDYDASCSELSTSVDCIREMPSCAARDQLLASALTNLAACMTYMHRCDDASAALAEARRTAEIPGMDAVEAVLLAAMDREEEMEACLVRLAEADSPVYDQTLAAVERIMHGEDPHFCVVPADQQAIASFWQWFADNEQRLADLYAQQDGFLPEEFLRLIAEHLAPCFPFKHPPFDMCGSEDFPPYELFFFSGYHRSLSAGYAALSAACPIGLASRWSFHPER